MKKLPTKSQMNREAKEWNNWKPGSGRKGWSPFDKTTPPCREGSVPLRSDGGIDMKKWEEELRNKQ